eukprot:6552383-Pyramimonas_sp.AAC.1
MSAQPKRVPPRAESRFQCTAHTFRGPAGSSTECLGPMPSHRSHVSWPHKGFHRRPLARSVAARGAPPKASGSVLNNFRALRGATK